MGICSTISDIDERRISLARWIKARVFKSILVTPANEQERAQAGELTKDVQEITGQKCSTRLC